MTQQLDPYELSAPDQIDMRAIVEQAARDNEAALAHLGDEWDLPADGAACSIEDTDCEACQ